MILRLLVAGLVVFLAIGCGLIGGHKVPVPTPGRFTAVATDETGAILEFEGRAEFNDTVLGDGRPRFSVQLLSEAGFVYIALEARRPEAGTYPIVEHPEAGEFSVSFSEHGDYIRETQWYYGGQSGELRLEESGDTRVVGTFDVELYSALERDRPLSSHVRITGQFYALEE